MLVFDRADLSVLRTVFVSIVHVSMPYMKDNQACYVSDVTTNN